MLKCTETHYMCAFIWFIEDIIAVEKHVYKYRLSSVVSSR
jgi:hypothetical protein